MNPVSRVNVLGIGISAINLPLATEKVIVEANKPEFSGYITVTGVHGVMESQRDQALKNIHNDSFLSVPDGMPMVWVGKWSGFDEMGRVYGPDLMLEVMEKSCVSKQRHFLFGGGDGVVNQLAGKLSEKFPDVSIVGKVTPPFRPLTNQEEDELLELIHSVRPHFFWVGLSTPKQERFMSGFLQKYPDLTKGWDHGLIMLGVGAAFDFHAGLVPQAPSWMQKRGLEWLFRLIKEPKRLWRRYLYNNPRFIWGIFLQLTRLKKYPIQF
jgi:N-acetylglucosaminyldiphosphoundecaprenol N-acetyl-beta-D-mannosaminyltransferase